MEKEKKRRGVLLVVSSVASSWPVKRLMGCNEAQGSSVNMLDTSTLTQPVAETSRCPHTLALISHRHTHWLEDWGGEDEEKMRN